METIKKSMEINENILKVSSAGICIEEPLELGKRYRIATDIDVYEEGTRDNYDGRHDQIFKARSTGLIELLAEGKRIIKAKDKGKMSKKLHGALYYQHQESKLDIDFETYYNLIMRKIVVHLPEIIDFIKQKEHTPPIGPGIKTGLS